MKPTPPPLPRTRYAGRRRAARTARLSTTLAVVLFAGCALTPPKPPECDGPWTPINPVRTQAPS